MVHTHGDNVLVMVSPCDEGFLFARCIISWRRILRFSDTDELRFKAESSGVFALCASMHEAKPSETMIGYLILVLYSITKSAINLIIGYN